MKKIPEEFRQELQTLKEMSEEAIDTSDIAELPEAAWTSAEIGKFYRPIKKQLTIRVDADVVGWLKEQGSGYQTKLNDILREAMLETRKKAHR